VTPTEIEKAWHDMERNVIETDRCWYRAAICLADLKSNPFPASGGPELKTWSKSLARVLGASRG
jgi:hypothetical protein